MLNCVHAAIYDVKVRVVTRETKTWLKNKKKKEQTKTNKTKRCRLDSAQGCNSPFLYRRFGA